MDGIKYFTPEKWWVLLAYEEMKKRHDEIELSWKLGFKKS